MIMNKYFNYFMYLTYIYVLYYVILCSHIKDAPDIITFCQNDVINNPHRVNVDSTPQI